MRRRPGTAAVGAWPSGKARDFGSRIRRFESFRPNQPMSQGQMRRPLSGEGLMSTGFGDLKVFSGSAHPHLTKEIADFLGIPVGQARLRRFPDSEVSFQIDENIRGTDVFIVQPTSNPVDQHLIEMLIMVDAFRRSSAARITAVIPYYGYARQLDAELAIIDKRRSEDGTAEVMNVIGDVDGRTCILQDDIIDTAGTIQKGASALKAAGAERVLACAVHGVLSGPAIDRIEN